MQSVLMQLSLKCHIMIISLCKFSVIQNVIQHWPELYYFLAVDNSNNTMKDIVKVCVANCD